MRRRRLWNRTFWTGVVVGVALVLLARLAINLSTIPDRLLAPMLLEDSSAHADAIVVLGAGVIGDCVPNLNGVRRAALGARLFRDGRAPLVIITGGTTGRYCPVADAMAHTALEFGVPDDRLILERQSANTHENGEKTAPLLRARGINRILLVTDKLHMRRAVGVFRHFGFAVEPVGVPIYEGHVDNVSMLTAGIRETAALAYYRVRGWMSSGEASEPSKAAANRGAADANALGTSRSTMESKRADTRGSRPIVILGASYAAGWKLASLDGIPVINAGVSGQQSFEMLARFDSDVVAKRPQAVVLWGFINDIFRAGDIAQSMGRMRDSYAEMIKRARLEGIEPIIATEVTIRPPKTLTETLMSIVGSLLGKKSYQDVVNGYVLEGNQWLRELARRDALLIVDLQAALADATGRRRREFAADDGSHISAAGYDAVTTYAQPILSGRLRLIAQPEAAQR